MFEFLEKFYASQPVNHWTTIVMFLSSLVGYIYVFKFFFSKEDKDERGRGIFAEASMITFAIMTVWFFALTSFSPLVDFLFSSEYALVAVLYFTIMLLSVTESLGILIIKRFK